MSFSDNLENDLKNLEKQDERDPISIERAQKRKQTQRANVLAAALIRRT